MAKSLVTNSDITQGEIEFERLTDKLSNELLWAHVLYHHFLDVWEALHEEVNEPILHLSPGYWNAVIKSAIDGSLLHLCRLFDDHPQALTLYNWLRTIEYNRGWFREDRLRSRFGDEEYNFSRPSLDTVQLKKDAEDVSSSHPQVKALKDLRNEVIAHSSLETFLWPELEAIVEIAPKLLETARTIVDRYTSTYNGSTRHWELINRNDLRSLLRIAREGLEKQAKQ